MLSILIPTYNYNAFLLVNEIQKQAKEAGIEFEIICLDDGSKLFLPENQEINSLENCSFEILKNNVGRSAIRNLLAKKASFDNLLFLDSDTIPVENNFIINYIIHINENSDIICGGIEYQKEKPNSSQVLRWKYGINRESKKAIERAKKPYNNILSANILIKKNVFFEANYSNENNYYGMDIYFSYQLMIKNRTIIHIDNPIFHLGLESNEVFFEKCLLSVKNRKETLANMPRIEEINSLLKYYKIIKKNKLIFFAKLFFLITESLLKKFIFSKNPNLIVLDLYRLGYICTLK